MVQAVEIPSPLFTEATPFAWNLNAGFLTGTLGNTTDTASRSTTLAPIELFLGYRKKKLRIGGLMAAAYRGQTTEPDSAGGQNLGGTNLFAALEAQYYFNVRWGVSLHYKLFNELELENQTASGYRFKYKDGSGLGAKVMRTFRHFSVFVAVTEDSYKTSSIGPTNATLTSPLRGTSFGLGIMIGNMIPTHRTSGPGPKEYDSIPTQDFL